MKSFKIINGDIAFDTNNEIVMTCGSDEEAQAIERCFTTDAGEWFLNSAHGLEYPRIRGKGVTDEAIQLAVIKAALQDKRVKEIIGIDIRRGSKRTVEIKFKCILASGAEETVPFVYLN